MIINTNDLKIYDISMPISYSMPVYKGKEYKRPIISIDGDFTTGSAYETRLELNLHTGTHLDTPKHMIPDGYTLEELDLSKVITACRVLDLTDVRDKITDKDLMKFDIKAGDFILLKTRNSFEDILEKDFVYVDMDGARYLTKLKIKGVGIDSLGIERAQPDHETHISLFNSDVMILEGLMLKDIEEGEYLLSAAPIYIPGAEAAPVRAYLMK
ncbi:MAG: cyclase family protein [Clostridiales bacterium]|jgi:arylformamidase|nr:cyclase family protein [Clostridiales bacterium]